MTSSGVAWPQKVADAVVSGSGKDVVVAHLDDLLRWITHKPGDDMAQLDKIVQEQGYPPDVARRQALSLVDQTLFLGGNNAWEVLGLSQGVDKTLIRARYKRLTQVFHPDKALGDPAWLNDRMDRIRTAYEELLNPRYQPSHGFKPTERAHGNSTVGENSPTVRPKMQQQKSTNRVRRSRASLWRTRIGDPKSVKRRVMGTILVVCSMYAGLLFLSSRSDATIDQGQANVMSSEPGLAESGPDSVDLESTYGQSAMTFSKIGESEESPQSPEPLVEKNSLSPTGIGAASGNKTPEQESREMVEAVAIDYAKAYVAGDLDALILLYTPDAKEKELQGRLKIRDVYDSVFENTAQRHMEIKIQSVTEYQNQYVAKVDMAFAFTQNEKDKMPTEPVVIPATLTLSPYGTRHLISELQY